MRRAPAAAVFAIALGALVALRPWHVPALEPPAAERTVASRPAVVLLAERRYEQLLHGKRAAVYEVRWTEELLPEWGDSRVVRDVTRVRSRTARRMGDHEDVFEDTTTSVTVRTHGGDLLFQDSETVTELRTDRTTVRRVDEGYEIVIAAGDNEEERFVEAGAPVKVDAESFLGPLVREGRAKPGDIHRYGLLSVARERVLEARLAVEAHDEWGLRAVEEVDGARTLWWFADDGSVSRLQSGDVVVRRDDGVALDDLPAIPAVHAITLETDHDLPRIFSTVALEVDVHVDTDETVLLPEIPASPFAREIGRGERHVRLRLLSHDDPEATAPLPVRADGFEPFLEPTPLMEIDHPDVVAAAQEAVGDAADAREAARRIAEWVFRKLHKGSPAIGEPTALQILDLEMGDCSEHALLFTALCRAAGIPARRCSGYVCIGSDWGAHAWAEIWVGRWIGADPTTNEIGTRARYILLARPDDPDTRPAALSAERTRIAILRAEFPEGVLDLTADEPDPALRTGVALAETPEGWTVEHGRRAVTVAATGFRAKILLQPDHGYRTVDLLTGFYGLEEPGTFAGRPALHARAGRQEMWLVPVGRETLVVNVIRLGEAEVAEELAALLRPTLERE